MVISKSLGLGITCSFGSTRRQAIHKDIKDEWAIVFRTSSEESAPQWPRNCSAAAPRGGAVVVEEE